MSNKKNLKVYFIISLTLGIIGIVVTSISMVNIYNGTKKVQELTLPLIYNFIPFIISFLLLKIGANGLLNRKK